MPGAGRLFRFGHYWALVACFTLPVFGQAAGTAERLRGLLASPPFSNRGLETSTAERNRGPVEFRAVEEEQGRIFFSLFETGPRRSTWVELGQPVDGVCVKAYDDVHQSATVLINGTEMTLPLRRAAAVVQAANLNPPAVSAAPGTPGLAESAESESEAEKERMEQVREEIRRRRALRLQGAPTSGTAESPRRSPRT